MHSTDFHHALSKELDLLYVDEHLSSQYAWWILEAITGKNKVHLLSIDDLKLTEAQQKKLDEWKNKILNESMPLQYLIGSVPFDGVTIMVEPPTLIPRLETEEWCVHLIDQLKTVNTKDMMFLDIATGSGCIALALAHNFRQTMVHGTDIEHDAIALSERNAALNSVDNVQFFYSDVFSNVSDKYDIIVSNPPYVTEDEFKTLEKSVTKWEDKKALVANDDGLQIIKNIIINALQYLKKNDKLRRANIPQLIIEIGYQQGVVVKKLFTDAGYNAIAVHKDMAGKDRYVTGRVDDIQIKSF